MDLFPCLEYSMIPRALSIRVVGNGTEALRCEYASVYYMFNIIHTLTLICKSYIEPWHADIFEFLDLRKNVGKEEIRARDLFLGLWVPDLFMRRKSL